MSTDCVRPVAILWDIENCAVPQGVNAEDVAVRIRMALKAELALKGPISVFSAYGDFSHLPRHTRQGCQKTGVNLIDIPHGKKDAADKAILVDMFLFALDNPPPCTIVLISGDVDFAPALHKLGQRGYCVVLAIPSGPKVSPALCNACQHLWSWPDIARGKGLTRAKPPLICTSKGDKALETVGGLGAINDRIDQATGIDHAKSDIINGVEDICHGFGDPTGGPSHNPEGHEALTKIPVGIFEESVKVPFHFAKESTKIPVTTKRDQHGKGGFDTMRSVLPVTSYSVTSYDNVPPFTSHGMNDSFASSKFVPPGGQHVCDWFATHRGRASGAYVAGEEGFGYRCKGLVHQSKADFEHHTAGIHHNASTAKIGPLFNMDRELANRSAEYAVPTTRGWDFHRPFPSPNCTYPSAEGPITRSQNARKSSANSKPATSTRKRAAHANCQGPSLQLKVKKKKMKKTKKKGSRIRSSCNPEAFKKSKKSC